MTDTQSPASKLQAEGLKQTLHSVCVSAVWPRRSRAECLRAGLLITTAAAQTQVFSVIPAWWLGGWACRSCLSSQATATSLMHSLGFPVGPPATSGMLFSHGQARLPVTAA